MTAIHSQASYGGWRAGFGIGRGARAVSSKEPWRPFVIGIGAGVTDFKSRRSTPGSRATSTRRSSAWMPVKVAAVKRPETLNGATKRVR